ncbi:MBL fold metallo-hydrolase [Blastococcus sp. TF02A-30]|uniref:MBL fold metallo-hydrolase n=1 Tax=Blastococcus sp. TF02A-30 TaxID=2250580 RepID=UPI000DEB6466|nr:MBL fold metallo-hydrolase [Blastococcus sp. TF02A-30]RBY85507.1 cobalamin biosynthesis protein CobU [Blastococcus sp. TF02A-30]
MEVTLLGTGAADGWPNPWCTCASCADARRRGDQRRQTSALVDGVLLLDLSPALPPVDVPLTDVATVLVTHAHPDHCAPFALLWRQWVRRGQPLTVAGPAGALDECRPWVAPDDPVAFVELTPGDERVLGGYRVRALAAEHEVPTLLYDVTGPDGGRLLHATDTGPLLPETLERVRGAGFDVVLLEETFGDHLAHGTAHLDLAGFPVELDRLRDVGAVTAATDVVAVHLSHHNPPLAELELRLGALGARVVPDGTTIPAGARRAALPRGA